MDELTEKIISFDKIYTEVYSEIYHINKAKKILRIKRVICKFLPNKRSATIRNF